MAAHRGTTVRAGGEPERNLPVVLAPLGTAGTEKEHFALCEPFEDTAVDPARVDALRQTAERGDGEERRDAAEGRRAEGVAEKVAEALPEEDRIEIHNLENHTFFARVVIRRHGAKGEEWIGVDSRPSDAIAVGVATNVPIYVAEHVLEEVG